MNQNTDKKTDPNRCHCGALLTNADFGICSPCREAADNAEKDTQAMEIAREISSHVVALTDAEIEKAAAIIRNYRL